MMVVTGAIPLYSSTLKADDFTYRCNSQLNCVSVLFSSLPIGAFQPRTQGFSFDARCWAFQWPITSSVTLTFNLN